MVVIFILLVSAETAFSFDAHYIVVAKDGSGNFKTITEAIESLPMFNYERTIIFVNNGTYKEKIRIDQDYIILEGESEDSTIIEYAQLRTDWLAHKDAIGPAVVNIHGDDVILRNLTIRNTQPEIGPHAFAVYDDGTRTIMVHCNISSKGADTVSPWNYKTGMYYMADCTFSGAVDFVCPRGWCIIRDSKFYEVKKGSASIWHAGNYDKNQKFVLENCSFDGVEGFELGRHHLEAQFYLLNCTFSKNMADNPIYRVVYHYPEIKNILKDVRRENNVQDESDSLIVKHLNQNRPFNWGERDYFYNCHRDGGDYKWFADNLNRRSGDRENRRLLPSDVTASWTFDGKWNPESVEGPKLVGKEVHGGFVLFTFSESVTVIGSPVLKIHDGTELKYDSGSGTNTLRFNSNKKLAEVDLKGLRVTNDSKIEGNMSSVHERDVSFADTSAEGFVPQAEDVE